MPQGVSADLIATKYGFSRDDVDAYAVESQKRAAKAWDKGCFKNSVIPIKDQNGLTILDHDEHMRPTTDMQALAALNPSFVMPGEMGGFDAVAVQRYPEIEEVNHVHHAGNSSGIVDGAAAVLLGSKKAGKAMGLKPRARIRAFANIGSEPALMLTGPVDVTEKLLEARQDEARRTSTCSSSTRPSPRSCCATCRPSTSRTTRSTSMAAPSPWAIRSAPPAR